MTEDARTGHKFNAPAEKLRQWIAGLQQGIGLIDEEARLRIMGSAGETCAADIIALCRQSLGKEISIVEDLIAGWNKLRQSKGLKGAWEMRDDSVEGIFQECGCPLIRSGMVSLHPVHCDCSRAMMKRVFERFAGAPVEVELKESIGRGDNVCHFLIRLSGINAAATGHRR